jgi:hypothetical protein
VVELLLLREVVQELLLVAVLLPRAVLPRAVPRAVLPRAVLPQVVLVLRMIRLDHLQRTQASMVTVACTRYSMGCRSTCIDGMYLTCNVFILFLQCCCLLLSRLRTLSSRQRTLPYPLPTCCLLAVSFPLHYLIGAACFSLHYLIGAV